MSIDLFNPEFVRLFTRPYFHLGDIEVSPAFLVKAFIFLAFLTTVMRLGRSLLRRHVLKHTSLDEGQKYALDRGFGYTLFSLGLLIGLQSAGLNLSSLAFLGGAVGIGIGFGLQNIAKNFLSGLVLLAERPVKVGDRVEVGSLHGDVVHIGFRATWVRTNDNIIVIVPNSELIEGHVTNWTANDRKVRFRLTVGVAYSSDPRQVRDVLLLVAGQHPDVLEDPAPDVVFTGFGDSSLNFDLRVWTTRQVRTPTILRSDLYYRIFEAFQDYRIEIPFPQRDLHVRTLSMPLAVPPQNAPDTVS
ncbi:MAG: mechanosensitive ion channel [Bryobacteraceae bacterium]|nr:mechanosensitive ion channel [Bryobacteraceae bacterium]